jgi:hypothetical protein
MTGIEQGSPVWAAMAVSGHPAARSGPAPAARRIAAVVALTGAAAALRLIAPSAPALAARVRALRAGPELLLVQPRFGHPDPPSTRTIRVIARRWGRALRASGLVRSLRAVRPAHGSSRATVAATLMERR